MKGKVLEHQGPHCPEESSQGTLGSRAQMSTLRAHYEQCSSVIGWCSPAICSLPSSSVHHLAGVMNGQLYIARGRVVDDAALVGGDIVSLSRIHG